MARPRILYVEDNEDNRILVRKLLEREGFDVLEAEDGLKGVECAQREKPDLILMDINLPIMNGNEAATRIKALPETAAVPIIGLSANVYESDRKKSLAAGCDGYIEKPIDVIHFPQQIREYLKGQRERIDQAREEPRYLREYSQQLVERLEKEMGSLQLANERLKEMDQLKDEFLRNLSHELRTPLTPVQGYIEMLISGSMGPLNEKQQKAIENISRNVKKLDSLIANLLEYAGLEAHRIPFHYTTWPLSGLLENVKELHRISLEAKRISLQMDAGEKPIHIVADRDRLREVFDHLLGNAIKFSKDGGTIQIVTRVIHGNELANFVDEETRMGLSTEKSHALITISDKGAGLKPGQADYIFDSFYQGDGGITRHFGGLGLGLPIAKTIVTSHGGRIWYRETPGGGATFQVLLPLVPG